MRWLGTEPAQNDAIDCKEPEEHLEDRTVIAGTHLGGVEPWQEQHDRDRTEHRHDTEQFVRNSAENGVEGQEIPFRHDMGGSYGCICLDVIVGMAEEVRNVEGEPDKHHQEDDESERVLDREIGMERERILFRLLLDTGRIVGARNVQRPDVQDNDACDHERQQIMQREEAVQRRVIDRIATPEEGDDCFTDARDCREQVGDDGCTPEAHLAPWKHVAHEGCCHHEQEDDDAENPQNFARGLVGAVIEAAEHMDIDGDEEHGRAIGVQIAQHPAVIHVTHDVFDRIEGHVRVRRVMHCEHDAGDDLRHEHECEDAAEGPEIVEISRVREGQERGMDQPHDGQAAFEPLAESALGNVGGMSAHGFVPVLSGSAP